MKTFDRKIADYSHSSLVLFFNSISNNHQFVANKVTCNKSLKVAQRTVGINDQLCKL